jgi:hypothetical protein
VLVKPALRAHSLGLCFVLERSQARNLGSVFPAGSSQLSLQSRHLSRHCSYLLLLLLLLCVALLLLGTQGCSSGAAKANVTAGGQFRSCRRCTTPRRSIFGRPNLSQLHVTSIVAVIVPVEIDGSCQKLISASQGLDLPSTPSHM